MNGGNRFPTEGPPRSLPVMDDRQLDAVAALTSFAQVGFGGAAAAAARNSSGGVDHYRPPLPESLGRQFSNSSGINSVPPPPPPGHTMSYTGEPEPPRRNPYYLHDDPSRSLSGSYHPGLANASLDQAEAALRASNNYRRTSSADYNEGDYRHPAMRSGEYHRPPPPYKGVEPTVGTSAGGYNVPLGATGPPAYLLGLDRVSRYQDERNGPYESSYRPTEQSHRDLSASQRLGEHGTDATARRPSPSGLYYHAGAGDEAAYRSNQELGRLGESRSVQPGYGAHGFNDRGELALGSAYPSDYANGRRAHHPESALYSQQTISHKPVAPQEPQQEDMEEDGDDVLVEAEEDDDEEDDDEEEDDTEEAHVVGLPTTTVVRGKPEAMARAQAAARLEAERSELEQSTGEDRSHDAVESKKKSSKKATSPKKNPPKKAAPRKKLPQATESLQNLPSERREFLLGEKVPGISESEYENLQELMTQFCRVPLLSEFSRPVSILHPELSPAYSKIITHPVDLGYVSRGIRRRQYKNCRDVRLDVWRVFANCVKYNSHPANKDAVPSFVSIALHLREYFNNLWQEYMLPSDPPNADDFATDKTNLTFLEVQKAAFAKRDQERKKRLENSGVLVLSKTFTTKASALLLEFIENGGRVDALDTKPLFGPDSGVDGREVDLVIQRLGQYHAQLEEVAESGSDEYTLDAFHNGLCSTFTEHVLEDNSAMRNRFRCRLDRFFWKQAVPLHEANSRGVTQSSIWGNLAATIWARESSKKVFWPALCLGILPPAEQREGWHQAVTERNESRLPEKLRGQLLIAKKRCEQAQKRQSLSYFLVEFLGTHEFIWVRETDIIENFDPNNDPNKASAAGKKPRTSRSSASTVVGSKTYATALQECVWANEEYENVLQDAFENAAADNSDDDNDEVNFSFHSLAQSDEEADTRASLGYLHDEDDMYSSDFEESNYLIAHDGLLDISAVGRKNTKKRAHVSKKKIATKKEAPGAKKDDTTRKSRSRPKEKKETTVAGKAKDPKKKERRDKREHREADKRRRKRVREHEKSQKSESRKKTKRGHAVPESDLVLSHNKRSRATAIVKAYLSRTAGNDECRRLAMNGVLTIPAALVDSAGLLGVALAFRATTGDLPMPDDGRSQILKVKPWMAIDSNKPKTSTERTDCLHQQIQLLEKDIARIRANSERRKAIASEFVEKRARTEMAILSDDSVARCNNFKKKKKSTKNDESGEPVTKEKSSDDSGAIENEASPSETAYNDDPPSNVGSPADESVSAASDGKLEEHGSESVAANSS